MGARAMDRQVGCGVRRGGAWRAAVLGALGMALVLLLTSSAWGAGREGPLVSNVFDDENVLNVLRYISAQTGCSILAEPSVQGWVTLTLKAVPLERALDMIVTPLGYAWVKVDDYYIVGSADVRNPSYSLFVDVEVVKLAYVKAEVAAKLLSEHFASSVKVNPAANSLVITGTRRTVERVKSFLKRIDVPPAQVVVEVALVEMPTPVGANTTARDVEAMVNVGRSQVLTTARLLATDGEAGEVSLTLGRPLGEGTPGGLRATVTLLLRVTPRVSEGGQIMLSIDADLSEVTQAGGGVSSTTRHRVSTTALTLDGCAVLAGAFSTGTAEERSSTALLVRAETVSSESEDSIEESAHPPRIPMLQS